MQNISQREQKITKNLTKFVKNDLTNKKLTYKQQRFVDEYLIDLNATKAAIRAGYSKRTARDIGCENLTKPNIKEEISKQQEEIQKRTQITQDKVIAELARIAFSNATDYVEIVTRPIKHKKWDEKIQDFIYEDGDVFEQYIVLKDTKDLTDEQKAAIACIKNTKHGINVEQCNKVEALRLLGQHLGLFKDNPHININNNLPENPYNGLTIDELKALAKKKCDDDGKS